MVNHKEILRLKSLGLTHREITDATGCGRNTVTRTLARAREQKLSWQQAQSMSQQEVSKRLFPTEQKNPVYKMPDYERSEEHTSELQSRFDLVCRLLLEK